MSEYTRSCTKCGVEKVISDFHLRRDAPNGRTSHCKACRLQHAESYRLIKSEHDRKRRAEKGDEISRKQRDHYRANSDRHRAKNLAYKRARAQHFNRLDAERMLTVYARAGRLFNSAKRTCGERGLSFNIEREDVEMLLGFGFCQVSGLPLDMRANNGRTNPFGPSLDRIDNSRGYEKDNIQIVCFMFNAGKNHNNQADFLAMCSAVHMMQGGRTEVIERLKELRDAARNV